MAAHENIHDYYLHQHRNIENYLELCLLHPEVELVHELRLCIKKLRAFHKLTENLLADNFEEHIHINRRVRKLYKLAGQLRDTQVQIQILILFEAHTGAEYTEFSKWLNRREMKQIARFHKKPQHLVPPATAQIIRQKIADLLASTDTEFILSDAVQVLSGLKSETAVLLTSKMNNRKLHRIRTIVKQMRYILNIMHHCYPDFKFEEVSVDSLREIEVAAGHWHDNLVRVELLDKFLDKMEISDNSEKFKYQKLLNAFKSELDIAFIETLAIARKALLREATDNE